MSFLYGSKKDVSQNIFYMMQNAPQKIDTVVYLKELKYCIENTKLTHIIYGYIKSKYTLLSFTKVTIF